MSRKVAALVLPDAEGGGTNITGSAQVRFAETEASRSAR